ncbi:TetR family transcriptional regulator [Acinetobacter lactucae]|uniref:TetR/AcrR family transcriptional regulator n=1 Tax=Acinetobacter lactucae TaxID=1785128 RepID=UPI0007A0222A|nr:TetR/AcrR family transcriptional regulator [Acinetobacter lactucae]KYQ81191.1 TetR family transcriptional regulator [Acinetobacter lactucae]
MKDSPSRSKKVSTSAKMTRRGRPVEDREAKRAELLKSAISVIASEGYAGTSIRKVAQHAGCTTGAVTYNFANKEEMVVEVTKCLFDEFDILLDAGEHSTDIFGMLQGWLDRSKADNPELWSALFQLFAHARHESAFSTIIRKRYSQFKKVLASRLEKGQETGVIRDDIPAEILADQISAISDGWMLMLPLEPQRFSGKQGQALLDAVITLISPYKQQ